MSSQSKCEVSTYDDGDFIRVAIVVPDDGVSFDLVDINGTRIAEINAFVYYQKSDDYDAMEVDHVIIDVIDKDDLFGNNNAITFQTGRRNFNMSGKVVSADFRKA